MDPFLVDIEAIIGSQEIVHDEIVYAARGLFVSLGGWDLGVIPPVTGFVTTDGFVLHDGHHRVLAAKAEGLAMIPALNFAAMRRGDKVSHRAAIRRYRRLIGHPVG